MVREAGLDLPCGAGRLGLQGAPGAPFTPVPVRIPVRITKTNGRPCRGDRLFLCKYAQKECSHRKYA